jgi:DnaJ-class molecular chaperone
LAKVHHPDVHKTGNADAFAEIAAAYAVLSDTTKRKQYDRTLDREEISQDFWKFAGGMLQCVIVLAQIMGTVAYPFMEILVNSVLESIHQSANQNLADENTMEGVTVSV